jgi:hypothetical protein
MREALNVCTLCQGARVEGGHIQNAACGSAEGPRARGSADLKHCRTTPLISAPPGTTGGEAQQSDIQQLLRELEMKKAKLNELKGEAHRYWGQDTGGPVVLDPCMCVLASSRCCGR